jgi:hypothetical protein
MDTWRRPPPRQALDTNRTGECAMKRLMTMSALTGMVLSLLWAVPAVQGQDEGDKVRITGLALSMGTVGTGKNETIDITIDRWSSAPARERLIQTFLDKKQDGLLRALEGEPELGRFRFPAYRGPDPSGTLRLGTPIRYAMNHPGQDGGRRIVIITPRIMGFAEVRNRPRTYDYPFTLFEMRFNKAGSGEGRMAYATQIGFDRKKNSIELEYYSSEPVRLNNLKLEVVK